MPGSGFAVPIPGRPFGISVLDGHQIKNPEPHGRVGFGDNRFLSSDGDGTRTEIADAGSPGRSSGSRFALLSLPSHLPFPENSGIYRISSPMTAAVPLPNFTGFPY